MSWNDFEEYGYIPMAERKRRMQAQIEQMIEDGEALQPILPFKTRAIAKSFWGRAWCRHLEQFSDYENRLPRGRSYVKNGAVFHLEIIEGAIQASVRGSELYELTIQIDPLDPEKWTALKAECRGKIGSLIELLQGTISDEIMQRVTDPKDGLFPAPDEIRFNCNCPDWADMCKHVAAALYGVAVRLDEAPELLFKLRGVDHAELIAMDEITELSERKSPRRRVLDDDTMTDVFGIDLD